MVKKTSYSSDEMERYLGSLKEHFTDGQKAIGEQYFDLKKDITEIKKTLDSHTQIINSHTEMLGNILVRLEEVKEEFKQKVDYRPTV